MVGMPLTLNLPPLENSTAASLTLDELTPITAEAIRRWRLTGADVSQLADVQYHIVDLPGSRIGAALPGHVYFDHNAAGYGWFVDATPRDDAEFQRIVAATELRAVADSAATGRVDLLTAALHETGHQLGLPDLPARRFPHHVMTDTIGVSTRRVLDNVHHRDDPHVPQRGPRDQFEVNYIHLLLTSRATEQRDLNFAAALDQLLADEPWWNGLFDEFDVDSALVWDRALLAVLTD